MTTTTKRPTVTSVQAGLNDLSRQVQTNQATQQERVAGLETRLDQLAHRERDGKEKIRSEFDEYRATMDKKNTTLTERVDEIGKVIDESVNEIKRTVGTLQESLDARLTPPPIPESPLLAPPLPSPGLLWTALKKSGWYPWLRIAFWAAAGVLTWHYLLVPALLRSATPSFLPNTNTIRPNWDVSTPAGAASLEVSREPFRSDTASRKSFGIIFARLDELVRAGQLVNFEGYYNEFRREMAGSLHGKSYDDWRDVWNRIAEACHRHGGGANDLRQFHANLMAAAHVVAGAEPASGSELYRWDMFGSPNAPDATAIGSSPDQQPFIPYPSTLTER